MKKLLIAVSAFAMTFGSCTKQTSTLPPVTDTVYIDSNAGKEKVDTSVTITGIKDIRTTSWSAFMLPISVNRNVGESQKVTMMVSGVPAKAKAKFSSETGYTTFNTNLMIETMFLAPGTYPLTIASKSEKGKSMDYTVNLVVDSMTTKESTNLFLSSIVNSLSTKDTMRDSIVYTNTNIYNNTVENQMYLRNVMMRYDDLFTQRFISYNQSTSTYHVKVSFNSNDGTLTIPEQEVDGRAFSGGAIVKFMISGTGSVDIKNGTFEITYTTSFDDNGTTVTSTYTLMGTLQ